MVPKRHENFYTLKAQKEGYVARSIYKLEELDHKFHLFEPWVKTVLDLWAAPGSRLQYVSGQLTNNNWQESMEDRKWKGKNIRDFTIPHASWEEMKIIGIDLKPIALELPGVTTYVQDATDLEGMQRIFEIHTIEQFDIILSDMAPDTTSNAELDALRSIDMIERLMPFVEKYLVPEGKFVFKVFMWPWFDQLVNDLKHHRWVAHIRLFKPKSCRKASKETFIVKI